MDENKRGKIYEMNNNNNNNCFIISLPYEILFFIFQFLDPLDIFRFVSRVNKLFNTISKDNQLLNNIIKNEKISLLNIPLQLRPENCSSPFEIFKTTTQIKIKTRQVLRKLFPLIDLKEPLPFSIEDLNKKDFDLNYYRRDDTKIQERLKLAQERIWPIDILEYLCYCDGFVFKEEYDITLCFFGSKEMRNLLSKNEIYKDYEEEDLNRVTAKHYLVIKIGEMEMGTRSLFYVSLEPEKYGYCFCHDYYIGQCFFIATSTLTFFQRLDEFLSSGGKSLEDDDLRDAVLIPLKIT